MASQVFVVARPVQDRPRLRRSPRGGGRSGTLSVEKGQLERSEVDTLAAYVKALGGKLKIVADFGDETYVLG